MSTYRSKGLGGFTRAAPRRRGPVLALALAGLTLAGCQSMGLNLCGNGSCGSPDPCAQQGPLRRLGQRVFQGHNRRGAVVVDGCEPGFLGAAPAVGAPVVTTPGVAAPGAVVTPGESPFGEEPSPLDLRPIGPAAEPSGSSAAPGNTNGANRSNPGTTGARGDAGRAVYETMRPGGGLDTARRDGADPLAGLPRLDAPAELSEVPGGVPPEADAFAAPAPPPDSGEPIEAGRNPLPEAGALSLAPGIGSFKLVEPRLAAGSLPGARGWSWLAEQGYRTVLDLRPSDQLRSEDLALINASGLRYVALPTSDADVASPSHLARFAAEIGQDAARPIYVFDSDGARVSVLWYLHEVANQNVAPDEAARVAAEIGPRVEALWARAATVVERLKPPTTPAATPATNETTVPEPPGGPVPDREPPAATPPPSTNPNPAAATPKTAGLLSGVRAYFDRLFPQDQTPPAPPDPTAWRPLAALAVAGLSLPLAFIGRTAITRITTAARASLPAPARSPRSIAVASGD
jgi:protein tyrosine phosphatase (PTP) superfamily phosphohydrolase (DUF442 family)